MAADRPLRAKLVQPPQPPFPEVVAAYANDRLASIDWTQEEPTQDDGVNATATLC
jgi:hypothetical protein